jgi:hypothetical protein
MSRPYSVHRPSKNRGDAVRLFCLECMGASVDPGFESRPFKDVRECPCALTCSLWPFRSGGARQEIPSAGNIWPSKRSRTRREVERVSGHV